VLQPVSVITFEGGWNLPVWAAQRQGFFERQGLVSKNIYTASSFSQMVGLIKGEFEYGHIWK